MEALAEDEIALDGTLFCGREKPGSVSFQLLLFGVSCLPSST
jgi:hypothetical protein